MSKYTTEVRYICEYYAGLTKSTGYEDIDEIVEKARHKIFSNYPIFDENHRAELEKKILKHYYMREIGFETPALFKLYLNNRMAEIMPYYNKLYESETFEFNPFINTDFKVEGLEKGEAGGQDVSTLGGQDKTTAGGQDVSTLGGQDKTTAGGQDKTVNDIDKNTENNTDFSENVKPYGREQTTVSETGQVTTTETPTGAEKETQKTHLNHSDDVVEKYSDTPQNGVSGVEAGNYLTTYKHTTTTPTYPSATSNDTVETKKEFEGRSTQSVTQYGTGDAAKKTVSLLEYQEGRRTDTNSNTKTKGKEETDATSTTDYGRTDTTDYGRTDTTDYGRTDTTDYGRTDTTEYGRTDQKTTETTTKGKQGSETYQEMLQKYRDVLLNIDDLIIKNLSDLFLNLW